MMSIASDFRDFFVAFSDVITCMLFNLLPISLMSTPLMLGMTSVPKSFSMTSDM